MRFSGGQCLVIRLLLVVGNDDAGCNLCPGFSPVLSRISVGRRAFSFMLKWSGIGYQMSFSIMYMENLTQAGNNPKKHRSRKIVFSAIAISLFFWGYVFYYGGVPFPPCIYTEEEISIPQELVGNTLILEMDTLQLNGTNPEYECLLKLGGIRNEIRESDSDSIAQDHYYVGKRTIEHLRKGATFRLASVFLVTEHGVGTIFSGSIPSHVLVLEDNFGKKYNIHTVWLGNDQPLGLSARDDDVIISYVNDGEVKYLNEEFFRKYIDDLNTDKAAQNPACVAIGSQYNVACGDVKR